jgi:hypothetical protein
MQLDVCAAAYSIDNRRSRMMANMNTCDISAVSSHVHTCRESGRDKAIVIAAGPHSQVGASWRSIRPR